MSSSVIGALRVNLGINTAQFTNGLRDANARMKAFGQQMAKIGAALSVVSTGLALAVRSQLSDADALGKSAQKIGLPVEALSRLRYAADLSGLSMEKLQTGVGLLSQRMADAAAGKTEAAAALAAVGVAATDAAGNLRPTEAVIADLADAFAAMEDGPAKTAAAMKLFGESGREMIPLLNGGAAALRAMGDEAERMGLVISEDTFRNAEVFNDNLTRLQKTMGALGTIVTAELAPVLARFSEVAAGLAARFQGMSPEVRRFATAVAAIGLVLGPVVAALGLALVALSAISAPVLAAAAALVALTAAAVAFWPEIVAAKDAVIAFGRDALDWIKAKPAEIAEAFRALATEMRQIGADIIAGLWDGLRERWDGVKAGVSDFAGGLADTVRSRLGIQSPSTVFAGIGRDIMAGLQIGLEGMQGEVARGLEGFAQGIASTFQQILTGTVSFKDGFRSLLAQSLGQAGGNLINAGVGGLLGGLKIPAHANGTRFAPGGLSLVGERGPELVNLPRGAQVIPNDALGAATRARVEVILGPGLEANILGAAAQDAVKITRTAVESYDRGLPDRIGRIRNDPWRKG